MFYIPKARFLRVSATSIGPEPVPPEPDGLVADLDAPARAEGPLRSAATAETGRTS